MKISRLAATANLGGALYQSLSAVRNTAGRALLVSRGKTRIHLAWMAVIAAALAPAAHATAVALAWDANPETDVTGYRVNYGTRSGTYTDSVTVGTNPAASINNLADGTTYYFSVSAINQAGLSSKASAEISYTVPLSNVVSPKGWKLKYVDSQETADYPAACAFDGDPNTFWHTAWRTGTTPPPHEIQIDLGSVQTLKGFSYLPRQDNYQVGNIGQYEFYVSADGVNWGTPVATGTFPNTSTLKEVPFGTKSGQYIRLRSLSSANGGNECSAAEINVVQGTANRAPAALAGSLTTAEDTPLAVTLGATDADGDTLSYTVSTQPVHGSLSGVAPDLTYSPAADFNGTDSFTFVANDGTVGSSPATVSITITPVNDAPLAVAKSLTTSEDTPIQILLAGTDKDGNPLTYSVVSPPSHGTVSGNGPDLTYSPAADFNGIDGFTFTANDGTVSSAPAAVSITVTPVNDAPLAAAKAVATTKDVPITILLTGTDKDGNALTYSIASGPINGTLDGTSPNLTYTPAVGFSGADAFTYLVNDGTVNSTAATVSISVVAVNNPPVAMGKSVTTAEDTPIQFLVAGTDKDSNPLTYSIATPPTHGVISGSAPFLTYSPAADFNGTDQFTFLVNDGIVNSQQATVSITVTPVNDAPLASAKSVTTAEDTTVQITLTGSDKDADHLTCSVTSGPSNGILTGTPPDLTYLPNANFNGTDQFSFQTNDGTLSSQPATVSITVTPVNDAPLAVSKSVSTVESTALPITLGGSDVEGSPLTFTVLSSPAHGTLTGAPPELVYTPATGYVGGDQFTYRTNDGNANSATATVSITINRPAPFPGTTLLSHSGWSLKYVDSQETFDAPGTNAFDGNPATYWHSQWRSGSNPPLPHEIQINLGSIQNIGGFQYLPRQDQDIVGTVAGYEFYVSLDGVNWGDPVATGTFANSKAVKQVIFTSKSGQYIRFRALSEVSGYTDTCVAELDLLAGSVANQPPLAASQSLTTEESTPLPVTLTGSDPDGNPITYSVVSSPANGTLSGTAPNFTYLPATDFSGSDQFSFRTNDGAIFSQTATVSITVTPVVPVPGNVAPAFGGSLLVASATEDEALSGQLIATDANAGDVLSFSKISGPAWLTVSSSGVLGGTPTNSNVGTNSFIVKVSDPSNASATAKLAVTVSNTNDAPVFKVTPILYPAGTEKIAYDGQTLSALATDPDVGDTFGFSKISGPAWLAVSKSGTLSGTPPAGSAGNNDFTIRVTDAAGAFAESALQIKINPNSLPLPWNLGQLGTDNIAGAARYSAGVFTVAGAGVLSEKEDSGNYGWQTLTGDGEITARVAKLDDTGPTTRVGLMIRESLASNACHVFVGVDGDGQFQWLTRAKTGGKSSKFARKIKKFNQPWIRLVRKDDTITAFESKDGKTWTKIGKSTVKLSKNCYIGLSVSSGNKKKLNTSKFTNVRVTR